MCLEDTVRIPLHAKDGSVRAYTLIDAADAEFLSQWCWRLAHGYAGRGERSGGRQGRYIHIYLHREILGLPRSGMTPSVDHINRDKLDNRRCNLRAVSHQTNSQNRPSHSGSVSAFRGVNWHKRSGKWVARIMVNGHSMYLGRFTSELDAAKTAQSARIRLMPGAID